MSVYLEKSLDIYSERFLTQDTKYTNCETQTNLTALKENSPMHSEDMVLREERLEVGRPVTIHG